MKWTFPMANVAAFDHKDDRFCDVSRMVSNLFERPRNETKWVPWPMSVGVLDHRVKQLFSTR